MGGGMVYDEATLWCVLQCVHLGKRTVMEVMEGLVKTLSYRVEDVMRQYGFGEFEKQNLQPGAMYCKKAHKVIAQLSWCNAEDLPGIQDFLLACDMRMAQAPVIFDPNDLEDDTCARATTIATLVGNCQREGYGEEKGKATPDTEDPVGRDSDLRLEGKDKGKGKRKAEVMPETEEADDSDEDVSVGPDDKETSARVRVLDWSVQTSAKTRGLRVRPPLCLQGTGVASPRAPSIGQPEGTVDVCGGDVSPLRGLLAP